MDALIAMFVAAVVIGATAEWKGRTGVAWWFLTLVLEVGLYLLVALAVSTSPDHLRDSVSPIAITIISIAVVFILMIGIVTALPKRYSVADKGRSDPTL